jgi:hypothetical protein
MDAGARHGSTLLDDERPGIPWDWTVNEYRRAVREGRVRANDLIAKVSDLALKFETLGLHLLGVPLFEVVDLVGVLLVTKLKILVVLTLELGHGVVMFHHEFRSVLFVLGLQALDLMGVLIVVVLDFIRELLGGGFENALKDVIEDLSAFGSEFEVEDLLDSAENLICRPVWIVEDSLGQKEAIHS